MRSSLATILYPSLCLSFCLACGPIGPFSGGALGGEVHAGSPEILAAIGALETVEFETRAIDPHSVNIWCAEVGGHLYIATSLILGTDDPHERVWVKNVEQDPHVRLRADGVVYLFDALRVEDEPERTNAWQALVTKYDVEIDDHARSAWVYRLDPR